jgi:hypothetical protein
VLDNGVRVWTMSHTAVPVVTIVVLLDSGTSADPPDQPGLASLTSSLMGEGAGLRDAIAMSDALARIGSLIDSDTGSDVSTLSMTAPVKHLDTALGLIADVARRPMLLDADLDRVRDLRLSRLKQSSLTATAAADRTLLSAVFGTHPYGHGALGTSRSISAMRADDVRGFWASAWLPDSVTVIVCGDVTPRTRRRAWRARSVDWTQTRKDPLPVPAVSAQGLERCPRGAPAWRRADRAADRPAGPARTTPHYHALVAFNAIVGGLFTSRINRNLRETRAITYGARTSFDMRRAAACLRPIPACRATLPRSPPRKSCANCRRRHPRAPSPRRNCRWPRPRSRAATSSSSKRPCNSRAQWSHWPRTRSTTTRSISSCRAYRVSPPADLARAAADCLQPAGNCVVRRGRSRQAWQQPRIARPPGRHHDARVLEVRDAQRPFS